MKPIKTEDIETILKHASRDDLSGILDSYPETDFVRELSRILSLRSVSKSDLIKQTSLDRSYAYQIIQGTKIGSKDKVLQLALALSCTVEETNRLLSLSDNGTLYAKIKRDAVLIHAINSGLNVMDTNELLTSLDFDPL